MNQDEFNKLRELLKWKDGEQPHPGYFNNFSNQVTSRIRAQEAIKQPSVWAKFLSLFDARPVMATAYALAVFGMMLFAFGFSDLEEPALAGVPDFEGIAPTHQLTTQFADEHLFLPVMAQEEEHAFPFQVPVLAYPVDDTALPFFPSAAASMR